mmetsp:Transcript_13268/g.15328  ORF Transcript_13268/g.15328 Transcript_13268/m.15328 type:complete len:253 (-) Transcript_13268:507-1265(-)
MFLKKKDGLNYVKISQHVIERGISIVCQSSHLRTQALMDLSAFHSGLRGKCYFRPNLFWQEVQSWHIADAGLEFRLNFDTKVNQARFPNSVDFESNRAQLEKCKLEACRIVVQGRDDSRAVEERLRNAVAWNKPDGVEEIIRTCYVTKEIAVNALHEACNTGILSIVNILLRAGTPAFEFAEGKTMNSLQSACLNGHEKVAALLIENLRFRNEALCLTRDARAKNALDLLRDNDMRMMANRLDTIIQQRFSI